MRGKSDSGKPRTLMYRFDFQAIQREAVQCEAGGLGDERREVVRCEDEQRENKHQLDSQQILLQELEKQQ